MTGPQSEQTTCRMLCQRALTCFVAKQKTLDGRWKHGVVNDIQESKNSSTEQLQLVRICMMCVWVFVIMYTVRTWVKIVLLVHTYFCRRETFPLLRKWVWSRASRMKMRDGRKCVHYTIAVSSDFLLVVTTCYIHGAFLYFGQFYQNFLRLVLQNPASLVHKVGFWSIEGKGL